MKKTDSLVPENTTFCVVGLYDSTGQVIADEIEAQSAFDAFYLSARSRDFSDDLCLNAAWNMNPAPNEPAKAQFPSDANNLGMYAVDFEEFRDDLDEKYPQKNNLTTSP